MSESRQSSVLDGVWEMVRAELDGEAAPEIVVQNTTIELTGSEYFIRFRREVMDGGTMERPTDPLAMTFVLRSTTGPNAGRNFPCLYQLAGDRLRICFGLDGSTPDGFKTGGGGARYLATYRKKRA